MGQQFLDVGAVANDGTGTKLRPGGVIINDNFTELYDFKADKLVRVKQVSDFGVVDSTKAYVLDGDIDFSTTSVEVPAGGITILGYSFDVSKASSSEDNYTMFTSPVGGSGDILIINCAIEVTGANSKVRDVFSVDGNSVHEVERVSYNNCTSLGVIANYAQGLETGTRRLGGTPELELKGAWSGGYLTDTSLVRGLTDGAYTLFKAGAGFVMQSRFKTNHNCDLPASASFLDFSDVNFPNPSTLQLEGVEMTRGGLKDPNDLNITPNIDSDNLSSAWINNKGVMNTFVGAEDELTTAITTTINTINVFESLAGTYTTGDLVHFDSPANGQLRHLGDDPRDFKVTLNFRVDGTSGNILSLRVMKWDDSAAANIEVKTVTSEVLNFTGGNDKASFVNFVNTTLDKNDYLFLEIANNSGTGNLTANVNSLFLIEQR